MAASVLLFLQRFDEAQDWLEFGISRDPTHEALSVVTHRLWGIAKARVRKAWVETPAGTLDLAEHFQVRINDAPSPPPRP